MLLDIGVGILSAIFATWFFDVSLNTWHIAAGIVFALGPDSDFLFYFPRRGDTRNDYKHRDIIHYPLLYLPIGTLLVYAFFGNMWALIFFVSSLLHFIHDSIAIGWGIKWLFPFSQKQFAFFYLYSRTDKRGQRKLMFAFDENTIKKPLKEHGDPNWVKNIYYKWHPIAIAELMFFVVSLIILYLYVK